ncbi:MAG TPA: hypothetical protein DEB07_02430, partial [Candidatus Moranbacteria bacterium]|nr:hypothetical protein [Candidatus Moranbacteria bacterium]
MLEIKQEKNIHHETIMAVFGIVFVSLFILANFLFGFILPLYFLSMAAVFCIAVVYPRSGLYAIVFLTIIFERFFTLAPLILGKT